MEVPVITGILRKSPELSRSTAMLNRDENVAISTITSSQDKGSVRFSDGDLDLSKMNTKLLTTPIEKVRFTYDRNPAESNTLPVNEEEDEDYSASVNAIIQRRVSSKRKKRRSSSPFSHEDFSAQSSPRRRSSGITVTSLETNASTDDSGIKEEQIYENIRLHKEVITNVKQQPWPIRRKLKLLQQAKAYVKRHEGELQDRLKQSRSTKDILTRFNILIIKKWQHTKREIINFMNLLIPWELRIKEIESHFGTVVASYFTFLRWLFWVNLMISIILTAFVIMPEILMDKHDKNDERRTLFLNNTKLTLDMLLNLEGVIKYSPIFYGYYSNKEETKTKYKIPTAYFMIGIGVYIYSFIAILRKMAVNFRLSKLSEKEDECIFTWKLFTGWDYMIGNAETRHNRTSSIVLGFKEALLEEAEKKKEKQSWKVISIRVFVNINVIWMLIFSARTVISVVNRSSDREETINEHDPAVVKWWKQNETTVVMTVIGSIFPFIFELFGLIEKYHPRKTLRIQLGRIMALNLLNLYTLTFAQFNQIGNMNEQLNAIRNNLPNTTMALPSQNSSSVPTAQALVFQVDCMSTDCGTSATTIVFPQKLQEFEKNIPFFTDPAKGKYTRNTFPAHVPIKASDRNSETRNTFGTVQYTTSTANWNELINKTTFDEPTTTEMQASPSTDGIEIIIDNSTDEYTAITDDFTNITMTEDIYDETEDTTASEFNASVPSFATINFYETPTENRTQFTSSSTSNILNQTESNVNITTPTVQTSRTAFESNTSQAPLNFSSTPTTFTREISTMRELNVTSPFTGVTVTPTMKIPVETTAPPMTCRSEGASDEMIGRIDYIKGIHFLNNTDKDRLSKLCWETMFGQELVKLTIMDLAENIFSTFIGDFIRALLVRYLNKVWCWDLEKRFPKYADFKIAENILHLVNNQGLVWMGMFFSPGLPLINVIKLMIMMYLRSWAVLTCNVPHEVVFRASRSNNFYLFLLLTMLFLCVLPVCYAIVWLEPSWHCGPFATQKKIYIIFVQSLKSTFPPRLHRILDYIASPGTVIPLIIILLLVIYYLASLTSALREANVDLKIQLRRERTEERKKMFQMASRRKRGGSDVDSTFAKWKKILQDVPSTKLSDEVAFPDDVAKAEDTDTDAGLLKHDEEEKQKIRKIFRTKNKTESASDKKWGTLLRMVPKQKEPVDKESDSTASSIKDDSSMKSENIPEIKISRVQTFENLMKAAEKIKQPIAPKIDEEKGEVAKEPESQLPKARAVLEKLQKRSNLKQIGKSAKLDSDSDEIEDDVFVESVVVDVPEMPRITESISNRIKRRLKKVLSMGSQEDDQQNSAHGKRDERLSLPQPKFSEDDSESKTSSDKLRSDIIEIPSTSKTILSPKEEQILQHRRSKLVKSESMNMETDSKWKNYMLRRKSSLDELHSRLPDV